jgi:hypothetical protein
MKKISGIIWIIIVVAFLGPGVMACSSSSVNSSPSPLSTAAVDAIREYADPATETTLQGLSENNLAKYVQNGSPEFKAALTKEVFDKTASQINGQLGNFISIQFVSTEEQQGYTIVHYKARYAKSDAKIRMVFDKNHLVAGQWFE